ncbi:hypothetical protein DEO72_LG3g1278 [Vigna unguiculata]|uniref:Uncharacterized protein n=1 Tax=Vigna unguiculata TaxID=3917 RepID=A0A4D6LDR6_VIGUN|nr:hypothetical protein DEO72_LG3g1278 [Vigna unguiculata]
MDLAGSLAPCSCHHHPPCLKLAGEGKQTLPCREASCLQQLHRMFTHLHRSLARKTPSAMSRTTTMSPCRKEPRAKSELRNASRHRDHHRSATETSSLHHASPPSSSLPENAKPAITRCSRMQQPWQHLHRRPTTKTHNQTRTCMSSVAHHHCSTSPKNTNQSRPPQFRHQLTNLHATSILCNTSRIHDQQLCITNLANLRPPRLHTSYSSTHLQPFVQPSPEKRKNHSHGSHYAQ